MTTATLVKPKRKSEKGKAPSKVGAAKKVRPPLYERLSEGIDEMRRHFAGEKTGVTVTVHVSPKLAATVVAEVKAAREAAGLTLAQVAARSRLTVGTLSKLESGTTPNPTVDTLARYAAAVGRVLTLGTVPMKHPLV